MAGTISTTAQRATPPGAESVEALAHRWSRRPDISARSALVTILGDTVAPLGGTVWLNDLINLAAPFGFNERLVRTSMFRLVSERWVANERVGRRSRYSLTPFGRDGFATAEARIYGRTVPAWDGAWTIVFLTPSSDTEHDVGQHLGWRGFAELSRGVHAAPVDDIDGTRKLVRELEPEARPLIASARFDDLAPLSDIGSFRDGSGLAEAEAAYRDFIDHHRWTGSVDLSRLGDRDAFLTRTMVVHDLRRARLRDPSLPRELLPDHWSGDEAIELAASAYRATDDGAWRFVETVTGLTADRARPPLTRRFATDRPDPEPDNPDRPSPPQGGRR